MEHFCDKTVALWSQAFKWPLIVHEAYRKRALVFNKDLDPSHS